MDLKKVLKSVKPNISDSSLKAYIGNLKNLHKMIKGNTDIQNIDFIRDMDVVMNALKGKVDSTIKNYVTPIVVLLKSDEEANKSLIDKYSERMRNLQDKIMSQYEENEKSQKQEQNWIEYSQVLDLLKKLKKEATPLLKKDKSVLTRKQLQKIQDYLLVSLYSGKYFPPIRNDYANMEIIEEGEKMDPDKNYLVIMKNNKLKFVYNDFKTKKSKGEQELIIKSEELQNLILNWLDKTDGEYLLIHTKTNEPMTANSITKNLNRIFMNEFGKKISSSMLRAIYISEKYDGKLTVKQKKDLAEQMQHSLNTAQTVYNKMD